MFDNFINSLFFVVVVVVVVVVFLLEVKALTK